MSLFQNIVILEFWSKSQWSGLGPTCDRHDKRLPAARFGSVQFTQCEVECNAMRCGVRCDAEKRVVKITKSK